MGREKSITGKYISNAIGYCHCQSHLGALSRTDAYKHKCVGKKCKWLEKYNEDAFERQKYTNKKP